MATSTSWIPQAGTLCRSSLIPGLLRYCPTGRGLHLCLEVLSKRAFSFAALCFLRCSRFRSFSFSRTRRSFSLACKQNCLSSCHKQETSPPRLRPEQLSTRLASFSLPPSRQPCASFLPACTMLTLPLGLSTSQASKALRAFSASARRFALATLACALALAKAFAAGLGFFSVLAALSTVASQASVSSCLQHGFRTMSPPPTSSSFSFSQVAIMSR